MSSSYDNDNLYVNDMDLIRMIMQQFPQGWPPAGTPVHIPRRKLLSVKRQDTDHTSDEAEPEVGVESGLVIRHEDLGLPAGADMLKYLEQMSGEVLSGYAVNLLLTTQDWEEYAAIMKLLEALGFPPEARTANRVLDVQVWLRTFRKYLSSVWSPDTSTPIVVWEFGDKDGVEPEPDEES